MMGRAVKTRTPAQNRRIWGLTAELGKLSGLGREEAEQFMRGHVFDVAGHESSSRLSEYQAKRVIAALSAEISRYRGQAPAREPWGPRGSGPRKGQSITPRQQQVLQAMFRQAGMTDLDRQRGFSQRQCKKPWPQTQRDTDAIIGALNRMIVRKVDPMTAWKRAQALRGHAHLDAWQVRFIPDLCEQFAQAEQAGTLTKVLTPHKLLKLTEAEVACGVES